MNKTLIVASLLLLPLAAFAQQAPAAAPAQTDALPTVSITANGVDVKQILHQLFTQAKKSYVIQPNTFYSLNLVLDGVDFDEALQIVLQTADLKSEVQNGIYFISRKGSGSLIKGKADQKIADAMPTKKSYVPESAFNKHLTTRLARATIAEVFASFGKQTGVSFEVDKSVPAYKLDAFLIDTSLRYALDRILKATGLKYDLTDHATIRIYKPTSPDTNRVAISQ